MEELIGKKFAEVAETYVPAFLSESESEDYPFLVYEQSVTPTRDKDGVYALRSELSAYIVSDNFDEADDIADNVTAAVDSAMNDGQFVTRLTSFRKDCQNGIWTITLNYTIKQIS